MRRGIWQLPETRVAPLSGAVAWYRKGTGITVTGSGVSQWDDQSGNGNHLLQGTDANRPIDGNVGTDLVSSPTVNGGWTDNMDGTYTHANGGGTDSIVETNLDGDTTYLTVLIVTSTTQGSVRMDLTGDFGTSRTANGTYTEVGTTSSGGAGTKAYAIVPSNDFDGTVQFTVQEITQDGSILFDGVDEFLYRDLTDIPQPFIVYLLFKQITYGSNRQIWESGSFNSFLTQENGGSAPNLDFGSATRVTFAGPALGTYGVVTTVHNGANSLAQLDNNTPVTGNIGTSGLVDFSLGASSAGTSASNIQVKEVIIYSAAHDTSQRLRNIRYLSRVGGVFG